MKLLLLIGLLASCSVLTTETKNYLTHDEIVLEMSTFDTEKYHAQFENSEEFDLFLIGLSC